MSTNEELLGGMMDDLRGSQPAAAPVAPAAPARQSAPRDTPSVDKPAIKSAPKAKANDLVWPLRVCGAFAFIIGISLWIVGAFYTLRGWPIGINLLASVLGIKLSLITPVGYWLGLGIPLGLGYSYVEVKLRPGRQRYKAIYVSHGWKIVLLVLVIWAALISTDLGSTYLSVTNPVSDAWQLARWVAGDPVISFIWSCILTFIPEWLILGGLYLIFR